MAERTQEDYKIALYGMGGARSKEFGRITTGYWFLAHCVSCGEFIHGVEYMGLLTEALVYDHFVAWYGLIRRST